MAAYSSFFFHIPQLPPTPSTSRTHHYSPSTASQFKSFLSLDIAESVLSRSSSIRDSVDNYSLSSEATASSFFPASLPPNTSGKSRPPVSARPAHPSRSSSTSSQSSSRRALPRPKPAPKETIPEIPRPSYARAHTTPATTRPRSRTGPSSIPVPIPAPTPRSKPAPEAEPVPVPPAPSPKPKQRPASTITATSTASTNYRRVKRTDALARLEGRIDTTQARAHSPPPYSPYAAVHRTKSAAPVLATKSFMPFSEEDSDSDGYELDDEKDVRVELEFVPREKEKEKKGRRARAGTIESWFVGPPPASAPAAPRNFMDFEDVDAAEDRYAKRGYL